MKKILMSILVILVVFSTLTVTLAYTYEGTYYVDFTASQTKSSPGGALTMFYIPGLPLFKGKAKLHLSVSNDATGQSSVFYTALNGEFDAAFGYEQINNIIDSGYASVSGQRYAKQIQYYASRTTDGNYVNWSYYFK